MKKTNVILKNANLDLLKNIDNAIETVEGGYKGNNAPCVVFEDDSGDVYFVAYSTAEYLQNVNRQPPTVDDLRKKLEVRLEEMAERTISLTQRKYRLTDATGTATVIRMEYQAWKTDNTTPTPTIDGWATDKGKTREEQLQAVGFVVNFLEKSAKIQELAWSRMDSAIIKEQIDTISSALDIVSSCVDIACVLQKADEVLGILRGF